MSDFINQLESDAFTQNAFWQDFCEAARIHGIAPEMLLRKEHALFYDHLDSTSTELMRRIGTSGMLCTADGALSASGQEIHKLLVATAEQTAGRGRQGRSFYSPAGSGVYFSVAYVSRSGVSNPALFTATAAVGVCRALKMLYGIDCGIKWVNDIYMHGKKLCGILTEGMANPANGKVEAAVIGIGINLHTNPNLPPELAQKVGAVSEFSGIRCSRTKVLAFALCEILHILDTAQNIMQEYKNLSLLIGATVTVTPLAGGLPFVATVRAISDDAGLVVQDQNGIQSVLHSGEVTLHT
ncbi:MAG: biotin--[acetyl-CoA-carboxylase] ligase [Treponema sp.]|nr:biotin--[acetyl-CoA-carboxylase] ligase [Treponema sp.]